MQRRRRRKNHAVRLGSGQHVFKRRIYWHVESAGRDLTFLTGLNNRCKHHVRSTPDDLGMAPSDQTESCDRNPRFL